MVGAQPQRIELGCGLSPPVQASLEDVVAAALDQLRAWGHICEPREVAAGA
jgi:Ni,Fe-hydrogenase maturation factor